MARDERTVDQEALRRVQAQAADAGESRSEDWLPSEATVDHTDQTRPVSGVDEPSATPRRLGDYELLAKLGEGGMGAVYKARHVRLNKIVALKVLPKDRTSDPQARARFEREMQAVGRGSHPNIVQAHDARDIDGASVLVMEYADGADLSHLVDRVGPLPVAAACEIIRQAAVGLQYAHENGLVHRDIKPSNILLTRQGQVKILDLGLALLSAEEAPGELTSAGQIMGTADYMAPEQSFDSHRVDIRADIYSLGCTLYKLLTGHVPYGGEEFNSAIKKVLAHLQAPIPSVASARKDVPNALAAIIERMMAKDRGARFATPAEVAEALAPFTAGCNLPALATGEKCEPATECLAAATTPSSSSSSRAAGEIATPSPAGRRRLPRAVAVGLCFLGLAILFGVIVKIRDKSGRETVIPVPEGAEVVISQVDDRPVDPAARTKPPETPATPPSTPVVPAPSRGREKPFALMRQGKEAGQFKTFTAVWDAVSPGDEIVVHGDGPFLLDRLEIKDRPLVLKAGPGFRPRFCPNPLLFFDRLGTGWLQLQKQPLTIEGCDVVVRDCKEPWLHLLAGEADGPVTFRNCRLYLKSGFGGVQCPAIRIEDCVVLTHGGYGSPSLHLSENCEVLLSNNLIWCGYPLLLCRAPGGQKIQIIRNTISFPHHAAIVELRPEAAKQVAVTAEGNLFHVDSFEDTAPPIRLTPETKGRVAWRGKNNWYAGLPKDPNGKDDPLTVWNRWLPEPEVDSHAIAERPLGWAKDMPRDMKDVLPWWRGRLEAARARGGMKDLGPDVSLVGPGEAYVRGLAAEGRPVPADQLRPEPLAAGAIVLIRAGKEQAGFERLDAAFAAAADGDIIEIRTDRVVERGYSGKDRGALTLRAAPGYCPTVSGINVESGTSLTVEGLQFPKGGGLDAEKAFLSLDKIGALRRVAYCSFDRALAWTPFAEKDGSPGEMFRCVVRDSSVHFQTPKAGHIRFRECLLNGPISGFVVDSPNEAHIHAEMEACGVALSMPWAVAGPYLDRCLSNPGWTARRCYFEGYNVASSPEQWIGQRNYYCIAAWEGVAAWRQATKSPETDSITGDPPLFDPELWRLPAGHPASQAGPEFGRILATHGK